MRGTQVFDWPTRLFQGLFAGMRVVVMKRIGDENRGIPLADLKL